MKFGQMLAAYGDEEYAALTRSIEALPLSVIEPLLAAAWRCPVDQVLRRLDESAAAASLGQVHYGERTDGTKVAIKVRYPDIDAAVQAELGLAGWIPKVGPARRFGFDLDGYRSVLGENMRRELDYRSEAARQQAFARDGVVAGLVVPGVDLEWCRDDVLVQAWHDGVRFEQALEWPAAERRQVGAILLRAVLNGLFVTGHVHADPHPGNYAFARDPVRVVLYDYGCIAEIDERTRLALLGVLLASRSSGSARGSLLGALAAAGFDGAKLRRLGDRLPAVCRALFRPFQRSRPFDVTSWHLGSNLERVLGDDRWWFRSAGPPASVLWVRAFQGLVSALVRLDAKLDWWAALTDVVPPKLLARAQTEMWPQLSDDDVTMPGLATSLCIRVTQGGEQRVAMTLPSEAAWDLAGLLPADVRKLVDEAGIDLDAVQTRVSASALAPGEVLALGYGDRHYRVWLA